MLRVTTDEKEFTGVSRVIVCDDGSHRNPRTNLLIEFTNSSDTVTLTVNSISDIIIDTK